MKIGIIGLWHQGVVGAGCFAQMGHEVTAADADMTRVKQLQAGRAPIYEPGLDDLLRRELASGRLQFTNDMAACVRGCRDVLFMFDTPVNDRDESDLTEFFEAARAVTPHLVEDSVVVVTAQVPVGTCDRLRDLIRQARPGLRFDVAYIPENLRLGAAIERFLEPALPVIGADGVTTFQRVARIFAGTKAQWHHVPVRTAEMTKHALNGFLATCISFANEIGNLCDEVGADAVKIAEVLRLEPRVGSKAMLFPGLGFSGGTLARDMQTLRRIGAEHHLPTPLLDGVWEANARQNGMVLRKLLKQFGTLKSIRVAVLGLTYKPGTSTLRRSAALEIIGQLVREGAVVTATDPKADRAELARATGFVFYERPEDAIEGADAVVLITPWPEYRDLPWASLRSLMRGGVFVDTANLLDPLLMKEAGYSYKGFGRGWR